MTMGNVNGDRNYKKEPEEKMLEIKNTVTEMKTEFDRRISRLDMTDKRISELRLSQ